MSAAPHPDDYCDDFGDWIECWSCGGEGFHELYDEDPLWYDEDDIETCEECAGAGGWQRADTQPTGDA